MPPLQRLTARVLGVLLSVVVAYLFKIDLPIGLIINILIVIFVLYLVEKERSEEMNYEAYSAKLKIITDPKRMKIIDLLSCGEMCACDILEHFDFTQPTLSHHMKTLENAGFVNVSKRGKWNYYSLNQETLTNFMREFNQLFFNSDNCVCQEETNKKEYRGAFNIMKLELFEEALCCSTGVCGPSVDENLLRITGIFESLNKINQVEANRYNLSSNPADFTKNELVLKNYKKKGNDILPITLVNDKIVKTGNYPTNEEIQEFTGIVFVTQNSQSSSCCGGNGTC